jgi:hypothetical protein
VKIGCKVEGIDLLRNRRVVGTLVCIDNKAVFIEKVKGVSYVCHIDTVKSYEEMVTLREDKYGSK